MANRPYTTRRDDVDRGSPLVSLIRFWTSYVVAVGFSGIIAPAIGGSRPDAIMFYLCWVSLAITLGAALLLSGSSLSRSRGSWFVGAIVGAAFPLVGCALAIALTMYNWLYSAFRT